jgi:integrase
LRSSRGTAEEVKSLLREASTRRNGARSAIALALGLRQGEALGLRWLDVDFDTGTLWVRRGRLRPTYRHGCGGTCGKRAQLWRETGYVCATSCSEPVNPSTDYHRWKRLLADAGLPRGAPSDARDQS